ncbi:hypothetical protein GCM10023189_45990 [Nibrella saemangeumensis]|uniref:N-acetyltransferase domain-containing protein n=1 Tax=Nibrella saemangeumensis TaxID=1084526 RepID=A0ABP8ND91_9BACT
MKQDIKMDYNPVDVLPIEFDILEGKQLTDNQAFKNRLYELVESSYQNADELIERIFAINDTAFVAIFQEKIIGILLFSYRSKHKVRAGERAYTAIYNGYAVTDLNYRNQGILQHLIANATNEFNQRISQENTRLLLYAITSNPFAVRAYWKVCEHIEPFPDGSYTDTGRIVVNQLKRELGISVEESMHPFKFTTSLPQRYSDFERQNFEFAPSKEKSFLDDLGITESIGDRLIFFWT